MIVKELEPSTTPNPLLRAGRRAEEQMAFYLRRAFAEAPHVRVFNNIRLERADDAAQMDHLILHRWGMIIVESKSVTSRVEINERSEWTRIWNGKPKGMASPVLQARRQGDLLKQELRENAESLRGKFLGLIQTRFGAMPIDVLVAISDEGVIKQPRKPVEEAVCKADQVPDRIRLLLDQYKKENSLFSLGSSGGYQLSEADVSRISDFLMARHRPLPSSAVPKDAAKLDTRPDIGGEPSATELPSIELLPLPLPISSPVSAARLKNASRVKSARPECRDCHGTKLSVEYGRYGYYFRCSDCGGNTPIKLFCSKCGDKARVRKSGSSFFCDCQSCGYSTLFHVNAETS